MLRRYVRYACIYLYASHMGLALTVLQLFGQGNTDEIHVTEYINVHFCVNYSVSHASFIFT